MSDKKTLHTLIMVAMALVPALLLSYFFRDRLALLFSERDDTTYRHASEMTEQERRDFYRHLSQLVGGVYEPVPEPNVGRIMQPNISKPFGGTEVFSNNAGMRSHRDYGPKPSSTYRIICLGDSFAFGHGGLEEDRYADQMEKWLRDNNVTVGGKSIEVLAVGLGSWSAVNQAAYLSSRLSSYDPDLILVLMLNNDLDDTQGVNGIGAITNAFSPEYRELGSSVFNSVLPMAFGVRLMDVQGHRLSFNLLRFDLGPESRHRWTKTFQAWKRLEELQFVSGGRMLFGVLEATPVDSGYFTELCLQHHRRQGMASPFVRIRFPLEPDYLLAHDPHPNREGHWLIAAGYLKALDRLGWLDLDAQALPRIPGEENLLLTRDADLDLLRSQAKRLALEALKEELHFNDLEPSDTLGFLGGLHPGAGAWQRNGPALKTPPWAMRKSVFLLRQDADARKLALTVEVPDLPELYPFRLDMYLNGKQAADLVLTSAAQAGRHDLIGDLPPPQESSALEVELRTDSYFTTVDDPLMRSYRLVSVRQE